MIVPRRRVEEESSGTPHHEDDEQTAESQVAGRSVERGRNGDEAEADRGAKGKRMPIPCERAESIEESAGTADGDEIDNNSQERQNHYTPTSIVGRTRATRRPIRHRR